MMDITDADEKKKRKKENTQKERSDDNVRKEKKRFELNTRRPAVNLTRLLCVGNQ